MTLGRVVCTVSVSASHWQARESRERRLDGSSLYSATAPGPVREMDFGAARVDGGVVPCLGPVRLGMIFEQETGRSAQAHAANLGATLAVTSCSPCPNHHLSGHLSPALLEGTAARERSSTVSLRRFVTCDLHRFLRRPYSHPRIGSTLSIRGGCTSAVALPFGHTVYHLQCLCTSLSIYILSCFCPGGCTWEEEIWVQTVTQRLRNTRRVTHNTWTPVSSPFPS